MKNDSVTYSSGLAWILLLNFVRVEIAIVVLGVISLLIYFLFIQAPKAETSDAQPATTIAPTTEEINPKQLLVVQPVVETETQISKPVVVNVPQPPPTAEELYIKAIEQITGRRFSDVRTAKKRS